MTSRIYFYYVSAELPIAWLRLFYSIVISRLRSSFRFNVSYFYVLLRFFFLRFTLGFGFKLLGLRRLIRLLLLHNWISRNNNNQFNDNNTDCVMHKSPFYSCCCCRFFLYNLIKSYWIPKFILYIPDFTMLINSSHSLYLSFSYSFNRKQFHTKKTNWSTSNEEKKNAYTRWIKCLSQTHFSNYN